jgi:tetratricopeptide (TPR) repeat protein
MEARNRAIAKATVACALAAWVAAACAGTVSTAQPTAEVPALEAQVRAEPANLPAKLQLATAYRAARRPADAATLLEPVMARDSANTAVRLHLALAYEDLQRWADARRLHQRNLAAASSARLIRELRARIAFVDRQELIQTTRTAIAQENPNRTPTPNTIGVLPLLTTSATAELRPYATALAELLTTDLAVTGRFRVLERARMRLLLDELRLNATDRVDPATAARAGRILSAARIVQGQFEGNETAIRLQALVVPVPQTTLGQPLQESGAVRTLFDMEKRLALSIYERMGVQLTAAERERVSRRQTENVQALLAFGFGLEAMDAGRFAEAIAHFERATQLDPNFTEARTRLANARDVETGNSTTTIEMARIAFVELGGGGGATGAPQAARLRFLEVERIIPGPERRDPAAEITGYEGLARGGLIDIIIRRPVGIGD